MAAKPKTTPGPSAQALATFEQRFGKAFGQSVLQRENGPLYQVIPTGSVALDYALGVGGLPEGRLIELWGPESAGKTTVAILMMVEAQRKHPDKFTAIVDMEQTWDPAYAAKLGLDNERNYVFQPNTAEEVADAIKMLMETGYISLIQLDSIGAMIPQEEVEKNAEDATVGTNAKIVTRMVKIAAVSARKHRSTLVIVNQVRDKISFRGGTTTGGGWALKHVTTLKLKFAKTDTYTIGKDDAVEQVGQVVTIKVEKNKVAPPGRVAKISIFNQETEQYGPMGIDRAHEAWTLGRRLKLFKQAGAFYTLPDDSKHQGEARVLEHLRAAPGLVEQIRTMALATVAHEIVDDGPATMDDGGDDE